MTDHWFEVGALADIPVRGSRLVKSPKGCLAVFRTGEDTVFSVVDQCPHKGGPLSQGIVHGNSVTCPLHNWVIDLSTGRAEGADEGSVATIPAEVRDGRVWLRLPV